MSKEINMDKSTISKAFNNLLSDFLDDILLVYPESKEIAQAKKSFGLLRTANPSLIIKAWKKHVYDNYKDHIDAENISFWFEKDYSKDLQDVSGGDDIMKMIENIRGPLSTMDENNRKHCSEYIVKLSKLSVMYQEIIKG
tara:strand:- start:188 stop:607 length:420 start_codon:yes stop_codon:yes gene_type:complete